MTETVATSQTVDAPAFPENRTRPDQLSEGHARLRDGEDSLRRVRLFDGREAWAATKHSTARRLLVDPRLSADRGRPGFPAISPRVEGFRGQPKSFASMDEPEHGPKRRMVLGDFTVKHVKAMREDVERIVHGFIDDLLAAGPTADLVSRLSLAVPSMVICQILGVPYTDHEFFQDASGRAVRANSAEEAISALAELTAYMDGLVSRLQAEPGPGLLSSLAAGPLANGEIGRAELVASAMALLIAGHETTASMTSLGVIVLLGHPDQLAELKADPGLMPGAVEELLRYLSIADAAGGRVAKADIEIDGQIIRAGEGVLVPNAIANRDGSVFEDPDVFDIHRSARHHVAFGYGVHQCLGQNLARLELEVIFTALFERIPTLRLAVPVKELQLRPATTVQGVNELPVTW